MITRAQLEAEWSNAATSGTLLTAKHDPNGLGTAWASYRTVLTPSLSDSLEAFVKSGQYSCEGGCDDWNAYLYGGFLLYIAATIDDFVTAPLRVRRRNQRLDAIGLTPVATNQSMSLALSGRF